MLNPSIEGCEWSGLWWMQAQQHIFICSSRRPHLESSSVINPPPPSAGRLGVHPGVSFARMGNYHRHSYIHRLSNNSRYLWHHRQSRLTAIHRCSRVVPLSPPNRIIIQKCGIVLANLRFPWSGQIPSTFRDFPHNYRTALCGPTTRINNYFG